MEFPRFVKRWPLYIGIPDYEKWWQNGCLGLLMGPWDSMSSLNELAKDWFASCRVMLDAMKNRDILDYSFKRILKLVVSKHIMKMVLVPTALYFFESTTLWCPRWAVSCQIHGSKGSLACPRSWIADLWNTLWGFWKHFWWGKETWKLEWIWATVQLTNSSLIHWPSHLQDRPYGEHRVWHWAAPRHPIWNWNLKIITKAFLCISHDIWNNTS